MEEKYDYVILGTGLTECILAQILAQKGCTVLHIDKNSSYGSETCTLRFSELEEKLGHSSNSISLSQSSSTNSFDLFELNTLDKYFSIDLTPKLLLADGYMKKLLSKYDISNTVSFTHIPHSYIYTNQRIYEVPTNERKSLESSAISLWQKPKVIQFFWNVRKYSEMRRKTERRIGTRKLENQSDLVTEEAINSSPSLTPDSNPSHLSKNPPQNSLPSLHTDNSPFTFKGRTMKEQFTHYNLNTHTSDFIGHAIALNLDDTYLNRHPMETYDKIYTYVKSCTCYNTNSPYIYPLYGLSELSQAFCRKAAIYGTTYRLNTDILSIKSKGGFIIESSSEGDAGSKEDTKINDDIISNPNPNTCINPNPNFIINLYDRLNNTHITVHCNNIISEPSYLPSLTHIKYKIIRCVCIVKGEVKVKNKKVESSQIIFLRSEFNRVNDIFVVVLGKRECVAPNNYNVCIISTVDEDGGDRNINKDSNSNPNTTVTTLLTVAGMLGNVVRKYVYTSEVRECKDEREGVYVTNSVDHSTHFESIYSEVERMCRVLNISEVLEDIEEY